MKYPNFREEKRLWRKGCKRVFGLDEAGRGPLSGPVVAAAVAIDPKFKNFLKKIKDSKKLTSQKREEIYELIKNHPQIEWAVGKASEKVIDRINILEATKLAMKRAVKNLEKKLSKENKKGKRSVLKTHDREILAQADFLLIDGNFGINLPCTTFQKKEMAKRIPQKVVQGLDIPQKSIIKADEKVFSCALASVVAKVIRDRAMKRYHKKYPNYGFDKHKGYGTELHRRNIKKYGICKIHRKTFKLVAKI